MNRPVNVYLFGSENNGWALDTDLALTRESLLQIPGTVRLVSLEEADVVHSVWEEPLFDIDQEMLAGKRVVCHACNDLMRLHENPVIIRAADTIGLWVGMSRAAIDDLEILNYPHYYVPYSVDTKVFAPPEPGGSRPISPGCARSSCPRQPTLVRGAGRCRQVAYGERRSSRHPARWRSRYPPLTWCCS